MSDQRIVFPSRGAVTVEPCEVLVRTVRTAVSAGTELPILLGAGPSPGTSRWLASSIAGRLAVCPWTPVDAGADAV